MDEAIKSYKYCSPNLSLFEITFLNDWWEYFVLFYPTWLAPNIISVVGLLCVIVLYCTSWYFSPQLLGEASPKILYLLFGFLLFAYQTLDGTDGKQARRTKSGSALGELMDHGIDAIVTGLLGVAISDAIGLDIHTKAPWQGFILAQMTFFMSNLTLLHRGKQQFFPIDIMELQWVMITVFIMTGVYGAHIWGIEFQSPLAFIWFPYNGIGEEILGLKSLSREYGVFTLRFIVAFGAVFGTLSNFILYFIIIEKIYADKDNLPEHVKQQAPGTGVWRFRAQVAIIILYGVLAYVCKLQISASANTASVETRTSAYRALIIHLSFCFGDLMDRVLIMRVAHKPLPVVPPTLLMVGLFLLLSVTRGFHDGAFPWYWVVAAMGVLSHAMFFVWIARRLAKVLGITVFTIKPMVVEEKKTN